MPDPPQKLKNILRVCLFHGVLVIFYFCYKKRWETLGPGPSPIFGTFSIFFYDMVPYLSFSKKSEYTIFLESYTFLLLEILPIISSKICFIYAEF